MSHASERKPAVHILWRIHPAHPAQFIIINLIHLWRKALVNVLCFHSQAINQAGAGPYSDLVTCRTPASVPDAISTLSVLEDEHVAACQPSPSVCLVLSWEEPSNNGAEITSYNIDLGDVSIPVGNVTSHIIEGLLPETLYRWVRRWGRARASHSSASLRKCSWHGGGLKMQTSNPTNQPRSTGICSHSLVEWIVVVHVQMLFSPAFFPLFSSPCLISDLSSFLSCSAKVRLHW